MDTDVLASLSVTVSRWWIYWMFMLIRNFSISQECLHSDTFVSWIVLNHEITNVPRRVKTFSVYLCCPFEKDSP